MDSADAVGEEARDGVCNTVAYEPEGQTISYQLQLSLIFSLKIQ